MEYHLYPPFFLSEPQTSFSKAWEVFCCRLLNLEYKTTDIYIREPPDRGVDLFWPAEGIAYQCKAVESGLTGGFQTAHVKTSLKKAQDYQTQIGWRQYILCTALPHGRILPGKGTCLMDNLTLSHWNASIDLSKRIS